MTTSSRKAVVAVVAVALACATSSVFAGVATSGQFQQVITQSAGKKSESMTQTVSWMGQKVRIEGVANKKKTLLISDGKTVYFYNPEKKEAMTGSHAKMLGSSKNALDSAVSATKKAVKSAKKIGTEKVGGFNCDVYSTTQTMGEQKINMKSWVNKNPSFPIEVKMTASGAGRSITKMVKSVKLGSKFPASTFVLPKGTKIVKHPDMANPHAGGQMPNPHKTTPKK